MNPRILEAARESHKKWALEMANQCGRPHQPLLGFFVYEKAFLSGARLGIEMSLDIADHEDPRDVAEVIRQLLTPVEVDRGTEGEEC